MKVIAAIIILVAQIPVQLKKWAYAGIVLFLITAIVAHTAHNDPWLITRIDMVLVGILVVS